MKFASTRGAAPALGIGAALAAGLAPDGGLYVPQQQPRFSIGDFDHCDDLAAVAERCLRPFFGEDDLAPQLGALCAQSLAIPLPLTRLDEHTQLLELFHGPTAAFKDFGARFLYACLDAQRRSGLDDDRAREVTVLVATSGDTGAAVAAAFAARAGFRVVVLYPDGRVARRQAHQLGCFGGNVIALRVAGTFDDCQALVKRALSDVALKRRVALTSANSISLGRWLPQMTYYAHAALSHWRARGDKLNVVVPTGNLGNALACIYARTLGLPIGDIALATNANRVLADFFDGADFAPRPSAPTLANAMDVGAPSNFERLVWLYPDAARLRRAFRVEAIDDARIAEVVRTRAARDGVIVCPHTATALALLDTLRAAGDVRDYAVAATAHPAKFDTVIETLIGTSVEVPPALAELLARESRSVAIDADYAALIDVLDRGE